MTHEESDAKETRRSGPVAVWDPVCPARLLLAVDDGDQKYDGNDDDANKDHLPSFDYLWSHTGSTTCSKYEVAALRQILQAHAVYQDRVHHHDAVLDDARFFSRACRRALRDCLGQWDQELQQLHDDDNDAMTPHAQSLRTVSMENLELLKVTLSALHLSEVFLPLLPSSTQTSSLFDVTLLTDPYHAPGAVTAPFVRYLRTHHCPNPHQDDAVLQMYQACASANDTPDVYQDGRPYWQFLTSLVAMGLLEDAWEVLSQHSLFQAAAKAVGMEGTPLPPDQHSNNNNLSTYQEILQDFLTLRAVLLTAPLPAGRTNAYDDDVDGWPEDDDNNDNNDENNYWVNLVPGLEPSDYRYWETMGKTDGLVVSPTVAMQRHQQWQTAIQRQVRHKLRLTRRLPQLDTLLAILCGDLASIPSWTTTTITTWPEALCAQMLYQTPTARPRDVPRYTWRVLQEYDAADDTFAQTIVDIMEGNAGAAIATFYIMGGNSGAALPTTLLSLMYNMFLQVGIFKPEESANQKTEFLTEAAFAIVSSLASTHSDIGIDLVTRLLAPFLMQGQPAPEVVACLAEILEHYNPTSESGANGILAQVETILERRKITRLIESYASVCLTRYTLHVRESRPGMGLAWLFRGLKMEHKIIVDQVVENMSCYKRLAALSFATTAQVLASVSSGEPLDATVNLTAKEMASEISREQLASSNHAFKVTDVPPVAFFVKAYDIWEAVENREQTRLSKCFLVCLTSDAAAAAPLSFQVLVLKAACTLILDHFEEARTAGCILTTSVFDKRTIGALLESLVLVEAHADADIINVPQTQEILMRGLAQALIAENTVKRLVREARGGWKALGSSVDVAALRTESLAQYSQSVQEEFVRRMLDE